MITEQHENWPDVSAELPRYRCHKEVWALKIKDITLHPIGSVEISPDGNVISSLSTATLTPEDSRYAAFDVDAEYVVRHKPYAGGYYVVYRDGYKSFSPAAAFEEGYTRI